METTEPGPTEDAKFDAIHGCLASLEPPLLTPIERGNSMVKEAHSIASTDLAEGWDSCDKFKEFSDDDDSDEISWLVKLFDPKIPQVERWEEDWDTDSEEGVQISS